MATKFIVKTLLSGKKAGNTFSEKMTDIDEVVYQDEFTGLIGALSVNEEVKYGYRLLAGEPCANDVTRTIYFLQVALETTDPITGEVTVQVALTFRYLDHKERGKSVFEFNKFERDD